MDCELFRLLIQRYHDGDLSYADKVEYESHRDECVECRALHEEFAVVFRALGNMPEYEPSADFNERVLGRVDLSRYRERRVLNFLRSAQSLWYRVPFPVRVVSSVGFAVALALVVFKPLLIMVVDGFAGAVVVLHGVSDVVSNVIKEAIDAMSSLVSFKTYESVFQTLVRAVKLVLGVLPTRDVVTAMLLFVLIALAAYAMRKQLKSKGETNVLIS